MLDGPVTLPDDAPLPMQQRSTGRWLVGSFRYDEGDGFYLLYAKPDSEIYRSGARHLLFPTPTLYVAGAHGDNGERVARLGNTWFLPANGIAHFDVGSPSPPTLLFTPTIVRSGGRSALAGDAVHVTVSSLDVELYSGDISAKGSPVAVRVDVPRLGTATVYEVKIACSYTGSEDPAGVLCEAREVIVRCGEALRADDFKLMYAQCRERVDHVAIRGLPHLMYGW
jgi:hypothetical protein